MLVSADLLQQSCNRYYAPSVETAKAAVLPTLNIPAPVAAPESTGPNLIGTRENLIKRKEMIAEMGQEPTDFAFERAIGKNDSVYSNFIELIALAKRKVGRVVVRKGIKNTGFATGFMVSDRLLLTNWHVFPTIREAVDSEVQFYYELDTRGNPISPITFLLDTKTFYHASETLDYCLVAVNPVDINGSVRLASIGYIFLDPALGKLGNVNEEALNIIHHPEGDYKQLSIRENIFIRILTNTIWYKTDTAPGSSGSPVFNDQWQVVALHHMGVPKMNEKGEYLDKGRVDRQRRHPDQHDPAGCFYGVSQ
jgi:endonuclease G